MGQRNQFVIFRREFDLPEDSASPDAGIIHLFADTRYRLRVNGTVIAHGPARFNQALREYDSVSLRPWLKPGANVLTVEVNHFGASSFQAVPGTRACFIAWGTISLHAGGAVDLSTPGGWQGWEAGTAWDQHSPPFSFAQGPVEILDHQSREGAVGMERNVAFSSPVSLTEPDLPTLTPRSIPSFSEALMQPSVTLLKGGLDETEHRYGFRVFDPEYSRKLKREGGANRLAYATWLHSSKDQAVSLGLFWGPHFLNGVELEMEPDRRGNRQNATANLRAGWNLLYGECEILGEVWGLLLGVPAEAELIVAAEPEENCPDVFLYTGALPPSHMASPGGGAPGDAEGLARLDFTWNRRAREHAEIAGLPSREVAWDVPNEAVVVRHDPSSPPLPTRNLDFETIQAAEQVAVFDFAAEYLGYVCLEIEAPAGTIVDLSYDETLREDGLLPVHRNHFTGSTDRHILRGGRSTIENFHPRGGRYLQVTLRVPREARGETLIIHRVGVKRAQVPLEPTGCFCCDDPVYDWAWQAGVDTLQACVEDAYLDCPWRERGTYLGDALVEMQVHAALSADLRVARRCLRLWASGQGEDGLMQTCHPSHLDTPLVDFSLIYVLLAKEYLRATGDMETLREIWPSILRIFNSSAWRPDEHGLWTAEDIAVFIDWGAVREDKNGPANLALNALRVGALDAAAELAGTLGLIDEQRRREREAEEVRRALVDVLWQPGKGCMAARSDREGSESALHGNILCLTFGVLKDAVKETALLRHVKQHLAVNLANGLKGGRLSGHAEFYFLHYAFLALYRMGEYAFAEELIRSHYGWQMQQGSPTIWENFGISANGSRCHAWSAAPSIVFAREILGVKPVKLGELNEFRIEPCAETLSWAKGAVPHPRGNIRVEWQSSGDLLTIHLAAPEGVTIAEVAPRGRLANQRLKVEVARAHSSEGLIPSPPAS